MLGEIWYETCNDHCSLESFIWRCCKLIVCQVWFISQISGQKPENSIIRWSNYFNFWEGYLCFSVLQQFIILQGFWCWNFERFGEVWNSKIIGASSFFSNCSYINWWQHTSLYVVWRPVVWDSSSTIPPQSLSQGYPRNPSHRAPNHQLTIGWLSNYPLKKTTTTPPKLMVGRWIFFPFKQVPFQGTC